MTTTSKRHQYIIECTLDYDCKEWVQFDDKVYISFALAQKNAWNFSSQEAEYNNKKSQANTPKIYGFRVVQQDITVTSETIVEYLI